MHFPFHSAPQATWLASLTCTHNKHINPLSFTINLSNQIGAMHACFLLHSYIKLINPWMRYSKRNMTWNALYIHVLVCIACSTAVGDIVLQSSIPCRSQIYIASYRLSGDAAASDNTQVFLHNNHFYGSLIWHLQLIGMACFPLHATWCYIFLLISSSMRLPIFRELHLNLGVSTSSFFLVHVFVCKWSWIEEDNNVVNWLLFLIVGY